MATNTRRSAYNTFNQRLIADLRANDGRASSGPFVGRPLLILGTVGVKSGLQRETPLVYTMNGDDYVVIASKGGSPTNPSWYDNLVANPVVTLEILGETFRARARVTEGSERDSLYRSQADLMPAFAEYQQKTSRTIPVVVLERIPS